MAQIEPDGTQIFKCIECGTRIVRIIAQPDWPDLCATCISFPQWFEHADLRRMLDPNNETIPLIVTADQTTDEIEQMAWQNRADQRPDQPDMTPSPTPPKELS